MLRRRHHQQHRPPRQLTAHIKTPARHRRHRRAHPRPAHHPTSPAPASPPPHPAPRCRGTPSTSGNTVRKLSCRPATFRQRRPQRTDIQIPIQPQRQRNVIHRLRPAQPVQKPHPRLRERQRQHPPCRGTTTATTGSRAAPPPALSARASPAGVGSANRSPMVTSASSTGPDAGDQQHRADRVSAQVENGVSGPDRTPAPATPRTASTPPPRSPWPAPGRWPARRTPEPAVRPGPACR